MRILWTALLGAAFCLPASAGVVFFVTLDTAPLTNGSFTGPFQLDLQLIDGGGAVGEPNNTATVDQFFFGGGSSGTTSATLVDSGFPPGPCCILIPFTPGTTLRFRLNITTNSDVGAGSVPDQFSFSIDAGNTPAILGPFVTIDLGPKGPGTTNVQASDPTGKGFNPTVTPASSGLPEPGSALLLGGGLLTLIGRELRRRRLFLGCRWIS